VEARIDLADEVVTLDGQSAGGSVRTRSATSWDRMSVTLSGGPSGTFLLSEVEAVDPVWEPLGTTVFEGQWTQPEGSGNEFASGVVVNARSSQGGLTPNQRYWLGDSTLTGRLGPVNLKAEASFERSPADHSNHGAYEATLPLELPGGTLEWTDRFSDRGLRSQRLKWTSPWVGTWDAQARAQGIPDSLDQQYKLSWKVGDEAFQPSLGAQWDQSGPTSRDLGGFGAQWVESWSWLVPPRELASYHRVQGDAGFKALGDQGGVELKGWGAATQTLGSGVKWTPEGLWSLKAPWHPSDQWGLTPSLSKKVEGLWVGDPRSPLESAGDAALWLVTQRGGLVYPPFVEFLVEAPWHDETASVASTAALEWTRAQGSEPSDLAVPNSATLKLATVRGRDSDEYRSATVSGALQARAINVFGSLGTQPWFPWYRTDVWTWGASGAHTVGTRSTGTEASVVTRVDLVLTERESLSVPTNYQGRWGAKDTQTLGLRPSWTLKQPADLPFELPRWLSPKDFRRAWVQEVLTAVDLGWAPGSPVVRNLQVGWKGRFLLSEKSELDFGTRWGQQWQSTVTVVGLEASVDLILSF